MHIHQLDSDFSRRPLVHCRGGGLFTSIVYDDFKYSYVQYLLTCALRISLVFGLGRS
jgi:hypothetical protein